MLVSAAADLALRAERVAARHGLQLELLDTGGGLGIPYTDDEHPLDINALGQGLAAEMATWVDRPALRSARFLLEPGRWLVGPAGVYLCGITRTKERGGRVVAISDGGIHHLLRPRLVGQDHRVVPAGRCCRATGRRAARPGGAAVHGHRHPGLRRAGPRPVAGDLFAVLDAGAYGYSESMPLFLSHPIPAEIVVDGGDVTVSRERREAGD